MENTTRSLNVWYNPIDMIPYPQRFLKRKGNIQMSDIFERNIPTITEGQQRMLTESTVFVAGCGGLGGFIIEFLVRLGVGGIVACDGDTFSTSNLNRQILATSETLGKSKALTARNRALSINPDLRFTALDMFLDENNAPECLEGCDLAMDALDNGHSRFILAQAASAKGIPLVHGAVGGHRIQTAVASPESTFLTDLYRDYTEPISKSVLSYVPAVCAALQVSQALSILTGDTAALEEKFLSGDIKTLSFDIMDFRW